MIDKRNLGVGAQCLFEKDRSGFDRAANVTQHLGFLAANVCALTTLSTVSAGVRVLDSRSVKEI